MTTETVITEQARANIRKACDHIRNVRGQWGEDEANRLALTFALSLGNLTSNAGRITAMDTGLWADWNFMGVAMIFTPTPHRTTAQRNGWEELTDDQLAHLTETGEWSCHS